MAVSISRTPAIERIARALAGERLSANAGGGEDHASAHVDRVWPSFRPQAISILKALREPDETMMQAGDAEIWERMVRAALIEAEDAGSSTGASNADKCVLEDPR